MIHPDSPAGLSVVAGVTRGMIQDLVHALRQKPFTAPQIVAALRGSIHRVVS